MGDQGEREFNDGRGNRINGLEESRGYLKRKLAANREIRKERVFLNVDEHVWRCNHRKESDTMR
jgi:hypothetical protein